jgi:mono/diheme cytochrome c family protein
MKILVTAAAISAVTVTLLAGVMPARAEGPGVDRLAEGKEKFETVCSKCHKLDGPLSKDMSRAEWDKTLLEMAGKGAEFSSEEQGAMIDYLVARSVFASRCVVCHTKERIFDSQKALAEWKATIEKMAAMKPELFSPGEVDFIADYLNLTLGAGPE